MGIMAQNSPQVVDHREFIKFIDNVPCAIYRTTFEGRLVFCNRTFARLFGFATSQQLVNYPVINLYRQKKDRGAMLQTLLKYGRLNDHALDLVKRDKTSIQCTANMKVHFDDDGMAMLIDGVMREIPAWNKSLPNDGEETAPNVDVTNPPSDYDRLQGVLEMAGGVAHHLCQPLTIINNLLEQLMAIGGLAQAQQRYLRRIVRQAASLNELARKIKAIQKYAATEYVAGMRIVDIDKSF
jgi:signal transduction histidine kinase